MDRSNFYNSFFRRTLKKEKNIHTWKIFRYPFKKFKLGRVSYQRETSLRHLLLLKDVWIILVLIFIFRETFPYYKSWDDRWKNSVRHNLSINPYFRKGTKARQGSGHLWTVNKSEDTSKLNSWVRIKREKSMKHEKIGDLCFMHGPEILDV